MPRISSLLKPVLEHPSLENVRLHLAQGDSSRKDAHEPPPDHDAEPLCLEGLTRTAKALALAALGHRLERPIIVLTSDNENAKLGKALDQNWEPRRSHAAGIHEKEVQVFYVPILVPFFLLSHPAQTILRG